MSAPRQNADNRSRPQGQPPISEQGIPNTVNNGQMDKQKLYTKQAHIHTAPPLHIRNKHYSKKYHHFKTWRKYAFLLIPLSLTANKTILNSKVLKSTHCVLKSSKIFRNSVQQFKTDKLMDGQKHYTPHNLLHRV